jgi:hypothetical protein
VFIYKKDAKTAFFHKIILKKRYFSIFFLIEIGKNAKMAFLQKII